MNEGRLGGTWGGRGARPPGLGGGGRGQSPPETTIYRERERCCPTPDHDIPRARAMLSERGSIPRARAILSEREARPRYTESESDFVRERERERERPIHTHKHAHARTHGIVCHRPPSTTSQITRGGTSPRYEFRIRLFSCHPPSPAHMLGL